MLLNYIFVLFSIILGYLIGSIPVGYIVAKSKGIEITSYESGRTGGTNVSRALGKKYGAFVGFLDITKGAVAVLLARYFFGADPAIYAALAGAFAIIGHNWSIFLGLRGGAGGATSAGALLALNPLAGVIMVPLFIIVLVVVRYASVATMTIGLGSLVILTLFYLVGWNTPAGQILFGVLASIAIIWALRPNIKRLIQGNERRITFGRS